MAEFASKGVGNAGLTLGIIGTAGWLPTAAMLASNRGYFVYAVSTKGTSAPTP